MIIISDLQSFLYALMSETCKEISFLYLPFSKSILELKEFSSEDIRLIFLSRYRLKRFVAFTARFLISSGVLM